MKLHDKNRRSQGNSHRRPHDKELIKKSYHTPRLFVYGNICEITQALLTGGKNDHAGGNEKT